MSGLSEAEIRAAFLAACRAELVALKPGNVHVHAGGHGMETHHFEASAEAAAPWIARPRLQIGERILRAVEASLAAAGCNTDLGILLLSAPLAAAAQASVTGGLRDRVQHVLSELDATDAANVFEAIRRANPGGLGAAPDQDVAAPPTIGLRAAMALAAGRDRIARAYVTDLDEIFAFGLPTLERIPLPDGRPSRRHHHPAYGLPGRGPRQPHRPQARSGCRRDGAPGGPAPAGPLGPGCHLKTFAGLLAFRPRPEATRDQSGDDGGLCRCHPVCRGDLRRFGGPAAPRNPLSNEGASRYLGAALKARRYPGNRFGDELSPIADNRDSYEIGQNRHAPG